MPCHLSPLNNIFENLRSMPHHLMPCHLSSLKIILKIQENHLIPYHLSPFKNNSENVAVVEEVGAKHVVQIITDNAANWKGADLIVQKKYDEIFWTPCVVHTLNLALKNIFAAKLPRTN
jgi:hypothetical protein